MADACVNGYLSRKVSFWLFKIFEIQKGRTFNFNDILRLCTVVVNVAIRSRAYINKITRGGSFKKYHCKQCNLA